MPNHNRSYALEEGETRKMGCGAGFAPPTPHFSMSPQLLSTKLFVPPPRSTLVPRPRLMERLSQGLTIPLTLISAPAGFGKTTLISEWRASNAGRDYPLACLSLDDDDNDPTRFLSYLVAALGTLKPDLAETAPGMLQSPNHHHCMPS